MNTHHTGKTWTRHVIIFSLARSDHSYNRWQILTRYRPKLGTVFWCTSHRWIAVDTYKRRSYCKAEKWCKWLDEVASWSQRMTILCFELEREGIRQRENSSVLSAMSQPQETPHCANLCCSTGQCCKIQKRMAVNACYFKSVSIDSCDQMQMRRFAFRGLSTWKLCDMEGSPASSLAEPQVSFSPFWIRVFLYLKLA